MDYTPNSTQLFPWTSLENLDIEAMAHAMGSSSHTSQSRPNHGNFGSTKLCTWFRRVRGKKLAQNPLDELIDECEGMEEGVLHFEQLRRE
jgi:hypothetical protein